jgi:hypothetical protein
MLELGAYHGMGGSGWASLFFSENFRESESITFCGLSIGTLRLGTDWMLRHAMDQKAAKHRISSPCSVSGPFWGGRGVQGEQEVIAAVFFF